VAGPPTSAGKLHGAGIVPEQATISPERDRRELVWLRNSFLASLFLRTPSPGNVPVSSRPVVSASIPDRDDILPFMGAFFDPMNPSLQ